MAYETNIELYTGDILHCRGRGFLSRLIRWFTKSYYSHTALVVECWGEPYVIDAQKNGVNPKPLVAWLRKYKYDVIVARPPDMDAREQRIFSIRAFSKVGLTAYDFALLLFRHPLSIIRGTWKKGARDPKDKMVCSEYVAWVFRIDHAFRMTPQDMYEYTQYAEFTHIKFEYFLRN